MAGVGTGADSDAQPYGLGPTRARVLAQLQDVGAALAASELGDRLGLHPNSVRFHLDALVQEGLVVREREPRTTPGRPRVRYAANPAAPPVARRSYRQLSEMLAAFMHEELPDPGAAAERVGRGWSSALPVPDQPDEDAALATLVTALDEIGFDSHVVDTPESFRVEVTHCPFLEVAERHDPVVCSIHLGLMRGVLDRMEAPIAVRDLQPLVEPSRCLAHLSR